MEFVFLLMYSSLNQYFFFFSKNSLILIFHIKSNIIYIYIYIYIYIMHLLVFSKVD